MGIRTYIKTIVLSLTALVAALTVYWDIQVRSLFEGRRWQIPSRVYSRPLELYPGAELSAGDLYEELIRAGYAEIAVPKQPGQFVRAGDSIRAYLRETRFWDGVEPARMVTVRFSRGRVDQIFLNDEENLELLRIEPQIIGHIYPSRRELRQLVRLQDVPDEFIATLLLVEDREFNSHWGIDPVGIARAMWANLRAGRIVQGGSTLTQQLVKNLYLSSERSLIRKFREAIMALLLEWHYSKEEILEAYLNEVFLGQSQAGAIHGVGLASLHYFGTDVSRLSVGQMALLVAMVKGPSYYDPLRHPKRARARRDLVLKLIKEARLIADDEWLTASSSPLGVLLDARRRGRAAFPAFLDLVRQQLIEEYPKEELQAAGLQIYSTFDPRVQSQAEASLNGFLRDKKELEGAVIIAHPQTGEVLAVVGGKDPRFAGFNRALSAQRPIGSLAKPFVALAALENGFSLASVVHDEPISVERPNQKDWQPKNYDGESHGPVPLVQALAKSYNQAFVRLGLEIGLGPVKNVFARLAGAPLTSDNPSLLLGAVEWSPLQVLTAYQVIAAGGFAMRPKAVRAVLDPYGEPIKRYEQSLRQVVESENVEILQMALIQVMRAGTGMAAQRVLPKDSVVAGKTGTSDQNRDSWFVGFGQDLLATVWIGRDDNSPTALTGSSGALKVWLDLMQNLQPRSLSMTRKGSLAWVSVNQKTGQRTRPECPDSVSLPFRPGSEPSTFDACGEKGSLTGWFKNLMKGG